MMEWAVYRAMRRVPTSARAMSRRSALGALAAPLLAPRAVSGRVAPLAQPASGVEAAVGQAAVHRAPRPLAPEAVTHDWTSFLGPTHNAVSIETRLSRTLPPPLVWEFPTGSGYASPAIFGDRLVYLHRIEDEEIVECLHPETGATHWRLRYPSAYRDRYGYNNGPRSSPVIDVASGRVYTVGAEGRVHAMELDTGRVVWRVDLRTAYDVRQDFFGISSTPLIEGGLLIVNVGGARGTHRRGAGPGDRRRGLAGSRGGELRFAGARRRARAPRVRLRGRGVAAAVRRCPSIRRTRSPVAQPHLRAVSGVSRRLR